MKSKRWNKSLPPPFGVPLLNFCFLVNAMPLDAIGIVSADLPRAARFYALLGIHFEEAGGPSHMEATLPSGVRLMLDSVELIQSINPAWQAPKGSSAVSLCVSLENADEVNALHQTILNAGYASVKAPWDAFWGQRYALVEDPDGNEVALYAPLG